MQTQPGDPTLNSTSTSTLTQEQNRIWEKWSTQLKQASSPEEYAQAYDEINSFLRDHGDPGLKREVDGTIYGYTGSAENWEKALIVKLAGRAGARILEIGCGDGRMAIALAQKGARVRGLDISKVAIEAAKLVSSRLPDAEVSTRLDFVVGSATTLAEPDATYDTAVSADMAEHLAPADFEAHLREVFRVLKPGGGYVITLPGKVPDEENDPLHLGNYHSWEVADRIRAAGFEAVPALLELYNRNRDLAEIFGAPKTAKSRVTHTLSCLPVVGPVVGRALVRRWSGTLNFFYARKPGNASR